MHVIRAFLIIVLLVLIAVFAFGWWTGNGRYRDHREVGTTGTVDTATARERGARAGEEAARVTAEVKETLAEATLTSKIKAKMALDDNVRARAIDVHTTGSTVTLSGHVRSASEQERAIRLARETDGVTNVVDRLTIQP